MILFDTVAIVGVGLIGGSLGLAMKHHGLVKKIIGIGHRRESLAVALEKGAIDEGYLELDKLMDADVVILATPVNEIKMSIPRIAKIIRKECIVIDVGSTKAEIVKAAEKCRLNFVGCHPLAGMEKRGVENARSALFENSLCLLIAAKKTRKEAVAKVKTLWEAVGAHTKTMDARSHDRVLAFVSHLPHAVAFCLIDCIKPGYLGFAASGLKDTTRISMSDPVVWKDIFLTNRAELLKAIKDFKRSLGRLESFVNARQSKQIAAYLTKSRKKRNAIAC
ncbi:MAG: hypothetical protein A2Y00_00755 [Omnitrophica WOR_2 bacterium GWF2_43_52]|nr:MAG: hypothetical protein A2062_01370 [Omnitrophica WOR_2 bacterium GWA2_44_7]OGX20991.1 MAG: hypothetical protein A2Y00_00755 [Omnitrophica WOR_2 bacterium GWF2_43_52]HAH21170.1 prephenate dehydrogenase/arogenate dehydrogenase family protein [Candidatus Omnitrophota bacterium]HBG63228.1 prephenate dehydrogenase/arogenate dehydrogenase family protein [Candidatus Omnitrophota bacterium]